MTSLPSNGGTTIFFDIKNVFDVKNLLDVKKCFDVKNFFGVKTMFEVKTFSDVKNFFDVKIGFDVKNFWRQKLASVPSNGGTEKISLKIRWKSTDNGIRLGYTVRTLR